MGQQYLRSYISPRAASGIAPAGEAISLTPPPPMRVFYILLALLLVPSIADAQRGRIQVEPELIIRGSEDLNVNIFNFTPDGEIPELYFPQPPSGQSPFSLYIGASVFTEIVGQDTLDLGVVYTAEGVTGELAVATRADGTQAYGCTTADPNPPTDIVNDIAGKIVMIRRGGVPAACGFIWKVLNAQLAGAVGVVIYNGEERFGDTDVLPGGMGGGAGLTVGQLQIPAVLIPNGFGQPLVDAVLFGGETLTATIKALGLVAAEPGVATTASGMELRGANPFATATQFRVYTERPEHVRVDVYNVRGQQVLSLFDGGIADSATITMSADQLPSGVYFVRATGETFRTQQQVTIVR